ncbi:MAG: DNA translocase FtsK 4TM domain-containing protein, partial [Pirellulales bacterium]
MFEDRNVKLDIFALALAAVVAFLAMALLSYDRADAVAADSPSSLVFPAPEQVHNVAGRMGAWTADRLLRLFGVGAFYLVASLAAVDVFLLLRRGVGEPVTRTCGWLMTLVGVTTLAAMAVPRLAPSFWFGPEIGPGGYLGAALRGLLEMNFAAAGSYILALSLVAAGLLLTTDYWLLRFAAWSIAMPASRMGGLVRRRQAPSRRKRDDLPEKFAKFEEFEEEDEEEESPSELNIRIGGRRRGEPEEVEDEEEDLEEEAEEVEEDELEEEEELDEAVAEDEEDVEDDEAATDEPGKKSVGQRLTAALRIRTPKSKVRDAARQEVIEELDEAVAQEDVLADYQLPDLNLLLPSEDANYAEQEREVRKKAKQLEKAFATFGYNVKVVEIETGPV